MLRYNNSIPQGIQVSKKYPGNDSWCCCHDRLSSTAYTHFIHEVIQPIIFPVFLPSRRQLFSLTVLIVTVCAVPVFSELCMIFFLGFLFWWNIGLSVLFTVSEISHLCVLYSETPVDDRLNFSLFLCPYSKFCYSLFCSHLLLTSCYTSLVRLSLHQSPTSLWHIFF